MPLSVFRSWEEFDRAAAMALVLELADTCACGHPLSVSTLPESMGKYSVREAQCHACAAAEAKSTPAKGEHTYPGRKFFTYRKT